MGTKEKELLSRMKKTRKENTDKTEVLRGWGLDHTRSIFFVFVHVRDHGLRHKKNRKLLKVFN